MDSQLGITLRPTTFAEVIGHDDVIKTLQTKLDKGEVPRALCFVGPPGTGKTTLAKIIARAVQGWDFPADEEPDMLELNAANCRKIDDIRAIVSETQTYPMRGKYRVIILDEAHQITPDAQNVLLKPFEEKNSATLWIICTTETRKILPALLTRCQQFALGRMSKKNIHDLLQRGATYLGHADFADFESEAIRQHLDQPRPLLNAFENYHNGMGFKDAINGQLQTFSQNHFEIAKAVVAGSWDKESTVWGQPCKAVKVLLTELEESFKKKNDEIVDAAEGDEQLNKDESVGGKPEASRALRAIVASLLKNQVIKHASMKAAEALHIISHCAPDNPADTGLEWAATVGGLLRVNLKMTGK